MLIGNKSFPYPLLMEREGEKDFKTSSFSLKYNLLEQNDIVEKTEVCIKDIHFYLDNKELFSLYEKGFVNAVCEIECSKTVYKEVFEITTQPITKCIQTEKLSGDVTISAYLYAIKDILDYYSEDFHSDYEGYSFNIKENNVLAADTGGRFKVNFFEGKDNKLSSIFSIIKKIDTDNIVRYESGERKIIIHANSDTYDAYAVLKSDKRHNNFVFSTLAIPALAFCLQDIKDRLEDDKDLEELCSEKLWVKSVLNRYKLLFEKELDKDEFLSINSYELAQMVMGEAVSKSVIEYSKMMCDIEETQEDYEYD
ncbi:Uncharacterised protein [Granulicatella adiacens]|uniref:hypothetical protein n=1 Tax=Granulicatella adiacens TaxID=46124 RepID=UPI00195EFD1C|nr:hypothetical protein [Granulicatella adiacens]VTX69103.1 Uncharacterised protein [Granulicatella adiacens]